LHAHFTRILPACAPTWADLPLLAHAPHNPPPPPPQIITVSSTGKEFKAGAYISINGTTGEVVKGAQPVAKPSSESGDLSKFMKWVDARRRLRVLTNAGESGWRGEGGGFGGRLLRQAAFFNGRRSTPAVACLVAAHAPAQPHFHHATPPPPTPSHKKTLPTRHPRGCARGAVQRRAGHRPVPH
jgi:hypothetical protein